MSNTRSRHASAIARAACFVGGGAATAAIAIAAGTLFGAGDAPATQVPGAVDQEPVLFVDVSGFGIGGPLNSRFAAYSDGTLMAADASAPFDDGSACYLSIDPAEVAALRSELRTAGAYTITDLSLDGNDIPVTTVTLFEPIGPGLSRARTFSYTVPFTPAAEAFAQIVQEFRATHLPIGGCSIDE